MDRSKITVVLACLIFSSQVLKAIEAPMLDQEKAIADISSLHKELLLYVFSFIPQATSLKEIYKKLGTLALVNSHFSKLATDPFLKKEITKRYIMTHPQAAVTEFLEALEKNNIKLVKAFLYDDILTDEKDINRFVASNVESIIKFLSEAGTDINAFDSDGFTLLMWAAKKNNVALVILLLALKADPNKANMYGETALMHAAINGHQAIVTLLLKAQANKNAVNAHGQTALMLASKEGFTPIVELLINAGTHINAATKTGTTALMVAASMGHKDIVKLLINAGALVNLINVNGLTALDFAHDQHHFGIQKILINHGAIEPQVPSCVLC